MTDFFYNLPVFALVDCISISVRYCHVLVRYCHFGVSPVNYSDSDSDSAFRVDSDKYGKIQANDRSK